MSLSKYIYSAIDWSIVFNSYRRITLFSRLAWVKFWSVAKQLQWLDENDKFYGIQVDLDILTWPNTIYAALGVVVYFIRLALNIFLSLRYILFAQDDLTISARFWLECKRRHWYIVGDIASATVNLLTNFSSYFNLAAPVVAYLVISLLIFTVLKLIYFYAIESNKIQRHVDYLAVQKAELSKDKQAQITLLSEQLNRQKIATQARILLSIFAGVFILTSFVISVTCAPQFLLPLFLYLSVVGGVLYLSADSFGEYIAARKEHIVDKSDVMKQAEMQEKRKDFALILAKNLFIPIVIIGLYAISWPAALVLTVLYIGAECYFAKTKSDKSEQAGKPRELSLQYLPEDTYAHVLIL